METIQEFKARHQFFLSRNLARNYAQYVKGKVKDLGRMANGSYGLARPYKNTIRIWAVERPK